MSREGPLAPTAGGRPSLAALLEPRSLAVVGASARPGSFGDQLVGQLLAGGYRGMVHLVNPRYREVAGLVCHPSLADLPEPVDLVVLAVPNAALEAQLKAAAAAGVPAAVIFASCLDPGPSSLDHAAVTVPPLADRLAAIAREAGMAVCGGNGMGFFNLDQSLESAATPNRRTSTPARWLWSPTPGRSSQPCSTTTVACASTWSSRPATSW